MDTLAFINSLFKPQQEQWAMQSIDNIYGFEFPEYHPQQTTVSSMVESDITEDANEPVLMGATDTPDDIVQIIQTMLNGLPKNTSQTPADITGAINKLLGDNDELKAKAQSDMYVGAVYKTVAAASDFFTRAIGLPYEINNINAQRSIATENYDNQIKALENQVLYIKHQLTDRFNKTVETNIMNLAAKNIRVNAGNVLDLSKEQASEITEDMRTVESNARLKEVALEAGKKSAKESARYAKKQLFTGLAQSAINLGLMYETAGGTNEKWGDLYSGYKKSKAIKIN